jgi:CRISPR-associated protein Csb2
VDAFAYAGRQPLFAEFDVELNSSENELLKQLVERIPYLGRAESWLTGAVVPQGGDALGHFRVVASQRKPTSAAQEPVKILGTLSAEAYLEWRAQQLRLEMAQALEEEQEAARNKGKAVPNGLNQKSIARLEAILPPSIVDCLYAESADLQRQGWSQPPGTQWLSYWIPDNALNSRAPELSARRPKSTSQAILFALSSDTRNGEVLPRMKDALLRGELFHHAVVARAANLGSADPSRASGTISPLLTGIGEYGDPLRGHKHVHFMPLSLESRRKTWRPSERRIDHILAWSTEVLDRQALLALSGVPKLYANQIPTIFLTVVGSGVLDDFRPKGLSGIPELGSSEVWLSTTPFVPPRFLKASSKNSLRGQLEAELEGRGFPRPERIEIQLEGESGKNWAPIESFWSVWKAHRGSASLNGVRSEEPVRLLSREWRLFRRERVTGQHRPPMSLGVGIRLTFREPVTGPLCLGYASHFGLGLFSPA